MALFSIEYLGEWRLGQFTQALVVAPSAQAALKAVEHLTDPGAAEDYKVTKEPVSGTRLLWSGFGE